MANGMPKIYDQLTLGTFLDVIATVSEPPVKILASREPAPGWGGTEVLSLEKYLELSGKSMKEIDPNGLSMKMLRECFQVTKDETISESSWKWTNWGTTSNGRFLTQKITFHKTGKGYTLSDIIEPTVNKKYFLSKHQVEKILFL